MSCCRPFRDAAEQHFNDKIAARDLEGYLKNGPGPTTRLLVDALAKTGQLEGALLDIGAGVGSLTFELLERGMSRAMAVDASSAYLAVAREEAARRGRADAIQFVHADFLDIASQLPQIAVVTLDRVICCYPEYGPFLQEALQHTERCFALSYPRSRWWVSGVMAAENVGRRLRKDPFRTYVHPAAQMEAMINRSGFRLASRYQTWIWSVDVYLR